MPAVSVKDVTQPVVDDSSPALPSCEAMDRAVDALEAGPVVDLPPGLPVSDGAPVGLSDRDRQTLEFEAQRWKYAGAKETAIWSTFDESPTRYYQRLLALMDSPVAEAEYPALVRRLRRVRDTRRAARRAHRVA